MVALLYTLDSPCGSTVEALEVLQTRVGVLGHLGVDALAIQASDVRIDVELVDSDYVLVLELSLKDEVSLTSEVTLRVELRLEEVEHVLLLTGDLSADRFEVLPGGLGRGEELGHGGLALDVGDVFALLGLCLHDLLDAVQHVDVVIIFVSVHLVQVELL